MTRLLGTLALVLALASPACTRKKSVPAPLVPPDPAPTLGPVTIQPLGLDTESREPLRLDFDELHKEAEAQLRAGQVFAAPLPDGGAGAGGTARVRIEVGLEDVVVEKKAAARAAIRLRIDARPAGAAAPHWNEDIQAGSETLYQVERGGDRSQVFQKLLSRTIHDLLSAYVSRQKLWTAGAPDLRAALAADAGDLRLEAIRAIGERHLEAEAPALLRLLGDDDEAVRDAALGALVEMRDRRAVTELAKSRSMKDRREMRKILDAIATLGGDEARDYLSFVSDAHEDEEIRKMAKDAQQRLKRRRDGETEKQK